MNESNTYEQSNSITMDEAKRSLYQMSLIDDFLLTSTLTDKEDGRKAAEILLSTLLHQAIDVVDVIPQKVYNGIHRMRRGIRLDAYITARSSGENSTANIYDIEAETRYDDKKTLPQRSRYYSSLIDVHHLKTGETFDRIPTLVIIMILTYDPFTAEDMYYEASTRLITHPDIPYDDGVRRLYFYTGGTCNIKKEDGGTMISDMLRYIQDSHDGNILNDDIRNLDTIVSKVRQREEVSIKYMKSWEKEAILIRETTQRVTEDVTKKVTEDVTERDVRIYIDDMRELGASDEQIAQKLKDRFQFDDEKIKKMLEKENLG